MECGPMSKPAAISARFRVSSVNPASEPGGMESMCSQPVTDGPGNESFSKWTPSGALNLTITNPDAQGFFVAGMEYDVVITPREVANRPTKETIEGRP